MGYYTSVATRNLVLPSNSFSQLTEKGREKPDTQNKVASSLCQKLNVAPSNSSNVSQHSSGIKTEERLKTTKLDSRVIVDGEIDMNKKGFGIIFKKFVVGFTAVAVTNMSIFP